MLYAACCTAYAAHGVCSEQTKWEWRTTRGGCVFTLGMHSVHHTSVEQSNHKSFGSKGKPAAALSLLPLPVMDRTSRLHRRRALVNEVILHLVSKPPVVVTARPLSDVDYGRVLEYALLCTRRRSSNQQCGGPSRRGGQHCRTHRLARRHSRSSDRVGALPGTSSSASLV